jgi:hypothetical protein
MTPAQRAAWEAGLAEFRRDKSQDKLEAAHRRFLEMQERWAAEPPKPRPGPPDTTVTGYFICGLIALIIAPFIFSERLVGEPLNAIIEFVGTLTLVTLPVAIMAAQQESKRR